jgi:hypothetical protein
MATIDRISTTAAAFSMKSSASATAPNRWSRISAVFNSQSLRVYYQIQTDLPVVPWTFLYNNLEMAYNNRLDPL